MRQRRTNLTSPWKRQPEECITCALLFSPQFFFLFRSIFGLRMKSWTNFMSPFNISILFDWFAFGQTKCSSAVERRRHRFAAHDYPNFMQIQLKRFFFISFFLSLQPLCPKSFYEIVETVHRSKHKMHRNWRISCRRAIQTFGPCWFENIAVFKPIRNARSATTNMHLSEWKPINFQFH